MMHPSSMVNCKYFFDIYGKFFDAVSGVTVLEVGSQNVNGGLRDFIPRDFNYVGIDFVAGRGVDVVLNDPYYLPFENDSADIVISNSCFEHSEMFWLVFLEVMRVLKPRGLFYLNAPSNGNFHRYPVDCWRFYPDSGNALVTWAKRNGINAKLLESYTSAQLGDVWNDFVAVFLKDAKHDIDFKDRILSQVTDFTNGIVSEENFFRNFSSETEDQRALLILNSK